MKTRTAICAASLVMLFMCASLAGELYTGRAQEIRAQEIEAVFLGNMGFKFTTPSGKVIVTDPWLDGPDFPANVALDHVDLILVSGAHFDNLGNTVALAMRTGAPVIATMELAAWISSQGVPVNQVFSMMQSGLCGKPDAPDDPCAELGISVKVVPAVHTAGIEIPGQPAEGYGGESVGFLITFENGLRLYFSGDTGLFGDMSLIGTLYKPHIAILSTAGRFMMEPVDGALATDLLRTRNPGLRTIIPAHHFINIALPGATGNPAKVAVEVRRLGLPVRVVDPVPGKPFTVRK